MISINNLSFAYKKRNQLFQDLDLEATPGNIYGLLGKNGAGKTTLLKLIAGLLFPKSGAINVMNYQPKDRLPDFLADIYLIPEEFTVPPISVNSFHKLYAPFYPNFNGNQFETYTSEFEIDKNWKMNKLSYGQKKKVLLSFGLATNVRLLILDEPTNGLDIPSKTQFRKLLAASITDEKCYIISTHQVRDITNLIDPIIILEDGKILFHETLESVAQKLYFETYSQEKEISGSLYNERIPGGYLSVKENPNGHDSDVDLEILFNAVVNNKEKIQKLFKKEVNYGA